MSVKDNFDANIKFHVRNGEKVFFWTTFGQAILHLPLHFEFICLRYKSHPMANDFIVSYGKCTHLDPIFRRDLTEDEESELFSLLEALGQVAVSGTDYDLRVWASSIDGVVPMASFYHVLLEDNQLGSPLKVLWKMKIPTRVFFFLMASIAR